MELCLTHGLIKRGLQMYHFMTYYILLDLSERGESNRLTFSVGRQSLRANNAFLILHCDRDAEIT